MLYYILFILYYIILYIFYYVYYIVCILYYIYSIIYNYICMCYTSFLDSTYECQQPGTLVKMKTAGINIDALSQESGNIGLERF